MAYQLTNEEKISIIDQHLKILEYNKYNLKISLLEMLAGNIAKPESISDLEIQIDSINKKQNALIQELDTLTGEDNG
jgi:predicted  nucleic acid-binding Zn-ribbon protein